MIGISVKYIFILQECLVKCKKEPMKEKSPKKEYDWYKQTGDDTTAWMDKYFATGRA